MRLRIFAGRSLFVVLVLLAGCTKITQVNFNKIQDGMSEQDVQALLGTPTSSSSVQVVGISGTASKWQTADVLITIRFVNGKVALKSFEMPAAKK